MKKIFAILLLVFTLPAISETVEEIVAKVNDQYLTKGDYNQRLESTILGLRRQYKGSDLQGKIDDVKKNLLSLMIEETLLIERAKQLYDVEKVVDYQIDEFMKENNLPDKATLEKALDKEGMTMSQFRKQITQVFIPEFVKSREIRSRISISTDDIKNYYNEHKDSFGQEHTIELEEIFFLKVKDKSDEIKSKALEVEKRLNGGESFETLAENYSDSPSREKKGYAGTFHKGELHSDIEKAIWNTPVGSYTPLIETENGWYLFKILKNSSGKIPTLDEAREFIVETIRDERFKDEYHMFIEKLKKENYIRINPKYI